MPNPILDGLALVDSTGRLILETTVAALVAGIGANLLLRARYAALERDLHRNAEPRPHFSNPALSRIARDAEEAAGRSGERNTQAIIEEGFQAELGWMLLAERFVRAATGLVIILGLLGTFYGLTLSIGKLVHLVSEDSVATADVAQAVSHGLTQALAGMAVAFSNSLVGIGSAVVLTVVGVVSNVTDRRTALMVQIETCLDRVFPGGAAAADDPAGSVDRFVASVNRLEGTVARIESALQRFAASTKDLREVQLVVALKGGDERGREGP
ncbi:MAG TPA: hypothetical protein VGL81_13505 [Polyangiaceae bacterium]